MLVALAVATLPKYVEWFDELIFTMVVFCTAMQLGLVLAEMREGYRKELTEDLLRAVQPGWAQQGRPRYFLVVHPCASCAPHEENERELRAAAEAKLASLTAAEVCVCFVRSRKEGDCPNAGVRLSASLCDRTYSYLLALVPGRNEAVLVSAVGGVEMGRWWGGEVVAAAARAAAREGERCNAIAT